MKALAWPIVLLTLIGLFGCSSPTRPKSEPLAQVAERALAEGKDAKLNVWFARYLGLKAEKPLPLKRLQFEKDGATNMLNVLRDQSDTIILSERRQLLATFYLTDRTGHLRRAVVNDAAIADGGITNLALEAAVASFEIQKQLWLQQSGTLSGEPDGAANGSQPIRSDTNSTSSAAGSRR